MEPVISFPQGKENYSPLIFSVWIQGKIFRGCLALRQEDEKETRTGSAHKEETASLRRTTVDIYADILEIVKMHGGHGRITKISYGVGMPVDRLKRFLDRLDKFGLISSRDDYDDEDEPTGTSYILTGRGQEFLDTYWRMKGFLEVLGGSI